MCELVNCRRSAPLAEVELVRRSTKGAKLEASVPRVGGVVEVDKLFLREAAWCKRNGSKPVHGGRLAAHQLKISSGTGRWQSGLTDFQMVVGSIMRMMSLGFNVLGLPLAPSAAHFSGSALGAMATERSNPAKRV